MLDTLIGLIPDDPVIIAVVVIKPLVFFAYLLLRRTVLEFRDGCARRSLIQGRSQVAGRSIPITNRFSPVNPGMGPANPRTRRDYRQSLGRPRGRRQRRHRCPSGRRGPGRRAPRGDRRSSANPITTSQRTGKRQQRAYLRASDDEFDTPEHELALVENTDVYIAIRATDNATQTSDVDPETSAAHQQAHRPILEERLSKRWCLAVPAPANARLARR